MLFIDTDLLANTEDFTDEPKTTLLDELLDYGFNIEDLPNGSFHYHTEGNGRHKVNGPKADCYICAVDEYDEETRKLMHWHKSDDTTGYIPHILDLSCSLRPTEDAASVEPVFVIETYKDRNGKICVEKYEDVDGFGNVLMQEIDYKAEQVKVAKRKRTEFVKDLDDRHRDFRETVIDILKSVVSLDDLYALTTACAEHDEYMAEQSGRDFCNTVDECRSSKKAPLGEFFIEAEKRFRKPKAVLVHSEPVRYPILMTKGKGGKALAFNKHDVAMYTKQGFECVTKS